MALINITSLRKALADDDHQIYRPGNTSVECAQSLPRCHIPHFGLEKFTKFAADGLQFIIVNSPLTSWLNIFGTQGASMFIGVAELVVGGLILYEFWRPASTLALAGAAGSIITFLTTLTFLLTTPDVIAPNGPPTPTLFGGFLLKDIVLLAASFMLLAQGIERRRA